MEIDIEKIKEQSVIYKKSADLCSPYEKAINDASLQLCLDNPLLLQERGKLLSMAREKVHAQGYQYRKKKSRSKLFGSKTETPQVAKKPRLTQELRDKRITEINEDLAELDKRLTYLEKSRDKFVAVQQYERAAEKSSSLRAEKRVLQSEMSQMQKLQAKSQKYFTSRKPTATTKDTSKVSDQASPEDQKQRKLQSFFKISTPSPMVTHAPVEKHTNIIMLADDEILSTLHESCASGSDEDDFLLDSQKHKSKLKNYICIRTLKQPD